MISIISWLIKRFLRLGLWLPGFLLPLLLFAAILVGDRSTELAASALLDYLLYALPALAAIAVLTSADRSSWDLILTRPLRFPGFLLAIWAGGVVPPLACHLLLIAIAAAAMAFFDSGTGAVEFHRKVEWRRGTPAAPAPEPGKGRAARIAWLERSDPWTFVAGGLRQGGRDLEGWLCAEVARLVKEEGQEPRLLKGSAPVSLSFWKEDGSEAAPAVVLELKDLKPAKFKVPRPLIGGEDRLTMMVERMEARGREDQQDPGGEAPAVVWFGDFNDRFRIQYSDNFTPITGLFIAERDIGFAENFLRSGLLAAGLLPLVVGLAAFAAALFSPAVAFATFLTVFVCGSAMTFLRDAVGILSLESAAVLLRVPDQAAYLKKPDWITQLFGKVAQFWIAVLPDFRYFRGGRFLFEGEAIAWLNVLRAQGIGLAYAAAFLALAALLLMRWEYSRGGS
ncbi:MAG: hypothetical protein HY717_15730 [Planctomycetes bacterium]|nr:hypothetical protein [Planctomycetota bacterium]